MRLYCEGDLRSPDAPILRGILRGLPVEVLPLGSRGALRQAVAGEPGARAIRDGDFPEDPACWTERSEAAEWEDAGAVLGWRWRRKEIENYIVDPIVLAHTLGWDAERTGAYRRVLADALAACAERTAARMALVDLLPRFERSVVRPFNPTLSGSALVAELRDRHRRARLPTLRTEDELLARFGAFLPLCQPGGPCWHPWVVAGKDLAGAFARLPGIRRSFAELLDVEALGARVAEAVERADSPEGWLPEWASVREAVGKVAT